MSNWGESPLHAPPQPTRLPNEIQDRIFMELMDTDTARLFVSRYPERLVSKQFFGLLMPYLQSIYIFLQYQPDLVFDYFYDHRNTTIRSKQWNMLLDGCKVWTQTFFRKTYMCYPTLPEKLWPSVKGLVWEDGSTDSHFVCFDPKNRAPNHVVQYVLYQFYQVRAQWQMFYIDIPFLFTFLTRMEKLPEDYGSFFKLRKKEWFLVISGRRREVNWPFWSYIVVKYYHVVHPTHWPSVPEMKELIAEKQMEIDIHDIAISELHRHGVPVELLYQSMSDPNPEVVLNSGIDEDWGNTTTDESRQEMVDSLAAMAERLEAMESDYSTSARRSYRLAF